MTIALLKMVEEEFIPTSQKDSETPTKFTIKSLSGMEMLDCLTPDGYDRAKVIQYGLVNWKNFIGTDGNLTPFTYAMIRFIPVSDLYEIVIAIIELSQSRDINKRTDAAG